MKLQRDTVPKNISDSLSLSLKLNLTKIAPEQMNTPGVPMKLENKNKVMNFVRNYEIEKNLAKVSKPGEAPTRKLTRKRKEKEFKEKKHTKKAT